MGPHEVEPWFHSWSRGRVETLDDLQLLVWPHEVEPWNGGRVKTLDVKYNLTLFQLLVWPHEAGSGAT